MALASSRQSAILAAGIMLYPKNKIRRGSKYFAICMSADQQGRLTVQVQTEWVGWADSEQRVEIREASSVIPSGMADLWKRLRTPFSVVNTVDDFVGWYYSGGNALVETTIGRRFLPQVKPNPCVRTGATGFKRIPSVGEFLRTLFRRAPTPKLRMAILKRDNYRCKLCGRRPENNTDIELDVHHIRPVGERGATHEDNLITLCDTCHNGLEPHYEWSLFERLDNHPSDPIARERQEYLRGVQAYRQAIRHLPSEESEGIRASVRASSGRANRAARRTVASGHSGGTSRKPARNPTWSFMRGT